MNDVVENGPAWESGVRAGDVIVTVNDWLIVLMDRPQVIWSALRLMMIWLNLLYTGSSLHSFERKIFPQKSPAVLSQQNIFLLSVELALIG